MVFVLLLIEILLAMFFLALTNSIAQSTGFDPIPVGFIGGIFYMAVCKGVLYLSGGGE